MSCSPPSRAGRVPPGSAATRPRAGRRTRRARGPARGLSRAALLALLALGACAEPDTALVRLVDLAPDARPLAGSGSVPEPLLDAAAAPRETWQPIVHARRADTAQELDAFREVSELREDGAIAVGAERGSWVAVTPVTSEGPLTLRCRVDVRGSAAARSVARVALVELDTVPEERAAALMEHELETHWGPVLEGPLTGAPCVIVVPGDPRTRAVAVLLSHRVEGDPLDTEVGAVFHEVLLRPAAFCDLAAEAALRPALAFTDAGLLPGRYTLERTTREGLAIAPGTAWSLPLLVPSGELRLEGWLGLVPLPASPGPPAGSRVRLTLELRGAGGRSHSVSADLEARGERHSLWMPFSSALPSALAGREATLRLEAETDGGAVPAIPVVATPRIVPREPRRAGKSVVVVSLDTLRADRVGAYGAERPTTPNIDRLAEDSLLFEDAWAPSPYTLPSHMSLFSGQYPSVHSVQREGDALDPGRTRLLAELLRERGYTTAAFTGGGYLHPSFGFAAGFERYSTVELAWNKQSPRLREYMAEMPGLTLERADRAGMAEVEGWLERHRDESFLLFFHTYAPHEFDPPDEDLRALGIEGDGLSADPRALANLGLAATPGERPLPDADRRRLDDLYDGAVHQADRALGELLEALRRLGLWDETVVVVLSDHGKEIGEHGEVGHGHTLYEELLAVPLLVRVPGVPPARVAEPASLVDVLPTILEALDLPVPAHVQGRSLLARGGERPLYAEVDNLAVKAALRRGSYKTIYAPLDAEAYFPNQVELEAYDLALDPREQRPIEPDPQRVRELLELRERLRALAFELASGEHAAGRATGGDLARELEALGYTQGRE